MNKLLLILLFALVLPLGLNAQSTFKSERLAESCVSFIKNKLQGYDIEVEILQKIKNANFEKSGVTAVFQSDKPLVGLSSVSIIFKLKNEIIKREDIRVSIKHFKKIPVASKQLYKGETISDDDISYQRVEVTQYADDEIITDKSLIGKVLKNGIIKGSPFIFKNIKLENTVKRGDKIEIIAQSGAVMVRTLGIALQDGAVGDQIRVKRDGSGNTILQGEVAGDGRIYLKSNYSLGDNNEK